MFCLKPFKKWSDLVRKICFSYECAYLDSNDEVVFSGIQILRYIKDSGVAMMRKQEEIHFQQFTSLYFVQGEMRFNKIYKL